MVIGVRPASNFYMFIMFIVFVGAAAAAAAAAAAHVVVPASHLLHTLIMQLLTVQYMQPGPKLLLLNPAQ